MTEPTHEPTTAPEPLEWSRLAPEPDPAVAGEHEQAARDYQPIHPGGGLRHALRKVWAPIAALVGLAFKFGFVFVKFGALFLSVGAYALLWGWRFGVGFVALILVHELGHFVEARRQGYHASLPMFVPFLGAFVAIRGAFSPWKNGLVALAGPVPGGAAAAVAFWIGDRDRLRPAPGARLRRLLPQPVQPDPGRVPRRRRDLALDALALARRRPERRGARRRVHHARRAARDRHVRRARPAAPPVMQDRRVLDRRDEDPQELREHVAQIAEEFRRGFEAVDAIDRPAVTIFGSARAREGSGYRLGRETGRLFAEAAGPS